MAQESRDKELFHAFDSKLRQAQTAKAGSKTVRSPDGLLASDAENSPSTGGTSASSSTSGTNDESRGGAPGSTTLRGDGEEPRSGVQVPDDLASFTLLILLAEHLAALTNTTLDNWTTPAPTAAAHVGHFPLPHHLNANDRPARSAAADLFHFRTRSEEVAGNRTKS